MSTWSKLRETPHSLQIALKQALAGDWGAQQDRVDTYLQHFEHQWGRLGFRTATMRPSIFAGFLLDGTDHRVALSAPTVGPDFCIVLSVNVNDMLLGRYIYHPTYRALVERLQKTTPPLGFEFVNQVETNQKRGHNINWFHPLLLRRNGAFLYENRSSMAAKATAIRETTAALLEYLFAGGEIDTLRSEFNQTAATSEQWKRPKIPKILHYCRLAPSSGNPTWELHHHACVKSAIERIQPQEAFLYYDQEPRGP